MIRDDKIVQGKSISIQKRNERVQKRTERYEEEKNRTATTTSTETAKQLSRASNTQYNIHT